MHPDEARLRKAAIHSQSSAAFMNIAVIGSGISGLSAAYCLGQRHRVVLFEADGRVGGHTNTIEVPLADGGVQPVDTGWIVYNAINYPNLTALFGELEVQTRPTSMSFGVSLGDGAYEWKGSDNLLSVFAQPANVFSPRHIRMLLDILKLNRRCGALLKMGILPGGTLGDFLDSSGFSPWLASRYLLPMAGLIWSCSPKKAREYPAADFMRFFDSHSLFTATGQPTWHTVVGGSHAYVKKILARLRGDLRLNTPVLRVERAADGAHITTAAGSERFDAVVLATHSSTSLRLLADASADERAVLQGIPYNQSRCVLHTDERWLPRRRAAWACWNYLNPVDEVHDRPIIGSYWMNLLQGIQGDVNYIVTLNPPREIDPARVLYDTVYEHPHYGPASVETHRRLPSVQGRGGVWFAGAWTAYGFHEDGLKSGLRAVSGIDRDCLPRWAVLPA